MIVVRIIPEIVFEKIVGIVSVFGVLLRLPLGGHGFTTSGFATVRRAGFVLGFANEIKIHRAPGKIKGIDQTGFQVTAVGFG